MNASPDRPQLQVRSIDGLLTAIPYVMGFVPETSLVVIGLATPSHRLELAFRYDLPDPPDRGLAADIAEHAVNVMARHHLTTAVAVGYGPGQLVSPVVDAVRAAAAIARLEILDALRVQDGRYWSYLCTDPSCCPASGISFDITTHPAAATFADAVGPAAGSRAALAATFAPLTGPVARTMAEATRCAERTAARLIARGGPRALDESGLTAVREAIGAYRDGGTLTPDTRHAWLALALISLRIRDDAWARMDPAHRDAHIRLWTDVVRRACPGYVAAPATLLAFTAWQRGDGALANIALDRALADNPGYTLAQLIRDAVTAGAPPSAAIPPMTPEQVADSYADPEPGPAGSPPDTD